MAPLGKGKGREHRSGCVTYDNVCMCAHVCVVIMNFGVVMKMLCSHEDVVWLFVWL